MFSVIFEVLPVEGRKDEYLDLAKHLKPILETIDGFVDNERFESKRRPGWVLSHSTWRDEKSVVRWRTRGEHHVIQGKGRFEIFADYHLRVGDVTFDTAPPRQAPILERRFDETEVGAAKLVTFTEITPEKGAAFAAQPDLLPAHLGVDLTGGALVEHDVFASIYNPGKLALLVSWRDRRPAMRGPREKWTTSKNCGTAGFGSCATMGGSTGARRPNSMRTSRAARPNTQSPRIDALRPIAPARRAKTGSAPGTRPQTTRRRWPVCCQMFPARSQPKGFQSVMRRFRTDARPGDTDV
jgi:heme-degrading monooxygenase HmoA